MSKILFGFIFILFCNPMFSQPIENIHFGSHGNPLNGLTVTWKSFGESDKIKWGYTEAFEMGEHAGIRRNNFEGYWFDYTFPIVKPLTEIYYSIFNSKENNWTQKIFKTSTDTLSDNYTFTVTGDSRTRLNRWGQVANAIEKADFNIFTGDLVDKGSINYEWDNWFYCGEKFFTSNLVYYTIGNHDVGNNNYENILVMPTSPVGSELYYSFNYGNAAFICLNSENPTDSVQLVWFRETLENCKDKTWKFVFFHKPFYSSGSHQEAMHKYFDTWWKLLDDYGVDLVLTGHSHHYERTKPINRNISINSPVAEYGSTPDKGRCQIVAGGAGAPLYETKAQWFTAYTESIFHYCKVVVSGNELFFEAKNVDGKVIDSLRLVK
ncbi:MAG: metallophosphoesterase [Bacteroidota bacterium]|nr:metallophosphoesterase [Bacteroidota bacterium]